MRGRTRSRIQRSRSASRTAGIVRRHQAEVELREFDRAGLAAVVALGQRVALRHHFTRRRARARRPGTRPSAARCRAARACGPGRTASRTSPGTATYNDGVIADAIVDRLAARLRIGARAAALDARPVDRRRLRRRLSRRSADAHGSRRSTTCSWSARTPSGSSASLDGAGAHAGARRRRTHARGRRRALAWRDERYAVAAAAGRRTAVRDRARGRALFRHRDLRGARQRNDDRVDGETRMWIARRSPTKSIDPGPARQSRRRRHRRRRVDRGHARQGGVGGSRDSGRASRHRPSLPGSCASFASSPTASSARRSTSTIWSCQRTSSRATRMARSSAFRLAPLDEVADVGRQRDRR